MSERLCTGKDFLQKAFHQNISTPSNVDNDCLELVSANLFYLREVAIYASTARSNL